MQQHYRILIAMQDAALLALLDEQFAAQAEFTIKTASSYEMAEEAMRQYGFDLLLSDYAFYQQWEQAAPLLQITICGSEEEAKSVAHAMIAPFRFGVLLKQIRQYLASHTDAADEYKISDFILRPLQKWLETSDKKKIKLTEKEVHILVLLCQAGDQPLAREELLHQVWGYGEEISTHTVETHIYRLRQKIEKDPTQARLLVTDAQGYRLMRG